MDPCPCGKPWPDLSQYDAHLRAFIQEQVQALGLLVPVTVTLDVATGACRTFLVSRYCIAYHGLTAPQLLSGASGFEETTPPASGRAH